MRIHDYTLPSLYSVPLGGNEIPADPTLDLEIAAGRGLWLLALGILQTSPTDPDRRDAVLLDAMRHLEEGMCLNFVKAARLYGPLPAKIDSLILEIAAIKQFTDLAALQLQEGLIQPWGADSALRIAAENNHRTLVSLLLDSPFCTQQGKNLAALAGAEWGALSSLEELLEREAVSGNYVQDSYCGQMNGNPIVDCICSRLIFLAAKKGYWDIADRAATYKLEKLQLKLSETDLINLAAVASSAGQIDFLQDILKRLEALDFDQRSVVINPVKRQGHYDLPPLFDPPDGNYQDKRHRRCHSYPQTNRSVLS